MGPRWTGVTTGQQDVLAGRLHDEVLQPLIEVLVEIGVLRTEFGAAIVADRLEHAGRVLDRAVEGVRSILDTVAPPGVIDLTTPAPGVSRLGAVRSLPVTPPPDPAEPQPHLYLG